MSNQSSSGTVAPQKIISGLQPMGHSNTCNILMHWPKTASIVIAHHHCCFGCDSFLGHKTHIICDMWLGSTGPDNQKKTLKTSSLEWRKFCTYCPYSSTWRASPGACSCFHWHRRQFWVRCVVSTCSVNLVRCWDVFRAEHLMRHCCSQTLLFAENRCRWSWTSSLKFGVGTKLPIIHAWG